MVSTMSDSTGDQIIWSLMVIYVLFQSWYVKVLEVFKSFICLKPIYNTATIKNC
jgi:hypothetical protein